MIRLKNTLYAFELQAAAEGLSRTAQNREVWVVVERLLMGNQAIAHGALRAGVNLVSGYPGTPSTEVLETVAAVKKPGVYVEWSVNEKAAMEVAAGAAYSGARVLVTMKQVGLNVASDPLMSLAYIGVKGGMVVLVADDPGPISSQTEQDTRQFAKYANLPVFDPCSVEEAYTMIGDAFAFSEKHGTPVLFRPTTRICHSCARIDCAQEEWEHPVPGFEKDSRWVIFPKLSYQRHTELEAREPALAEELSAYAGNRISGSGGMGVAASGVGYGYACEALGALGASVKLFKVATANPFPEQLALQFLQGLERVLVVEELDPVIEENLLLLCGKHGIQVNILGKKTGALPCAGEYSAQLVKQALGTFLERETPRMEPPVLPELPIRPPVLCAGCPHRASFYAVKRAMRGQDAVFTGDIGCYTLGNAAPLDMVDTCLCMGAGITVAQGIKRCAPGKKLFAFIGDSTFFHTGIPGVVNAVYNQTDITVIVLDNSTTAMTGHQPHPGTGRTMMGVEHGKLDIEGMLRACGVSYLETVDPFDQEKAVAAVRAASETQGVSAVVFRAPCIALFKPPHRFQVAENCIGCRKCIREIGCPAISLQEGRAAIDPATCYGCGLCAGLCPVEAICVEEGGGKK